MAKKKIKADPANNPDEIAGWEKRYPTMGFQIIDGKLVEVPVPVPSKVAGRTKQD